jgi:antitoxin HicB
MSASEYKVEVHPRSQEEGGGFLAVVPQLPQCNATGATPEEAGEKAVEAIMKVLAARAVSA